MGQTVEIVPLEAAEIGLSGLGLVVVEQLSHSLRITRIPSALSQDHVGRVERGTLLGLGRLKFVVERTNFIALALRLIALGVSLGCLYLSLSGVSAGLCLGCGRSDSLPGGDRGAEDEA